MRILWMRLRSLRRHRRGPNRSLGCGRAQHQRGPPRLSHTQERDTNAIYDFITLTITLMFGYDFAFVFDLDMIDAFLDYLSQEKLHEQYGDVK